jgi:hypothetical protein
MEDNKAHQERYFHEAKEIYSVRSKVVHGDKIRDNEEQAAIYLVEAIVPMAERFARAALRKILSMGLANTFNNSERVDKLFDRLLFSTSLAEAIAAISR